MSQTLQLILDVEKAMPSRLNGISNEWHGVAEGWPQSKGEYIYQEPRTGLVTIRPYQLYADTHLLGAAYFRRWGLSDWSGYTESRWDEVKRNEDRWLLSDGVSETITTTDGITADTGVCVDFFVYGAESDRYNVFDLTISNWTLSIWSDGLVTFTDPDSDESRTGGLTVPGVSTLVNRITRLLVIPAAIPGLFVVTADGGGFLYRLNPEREAENIIEAGDISIDTLGNKQYLQVSEITYPTTVDPWLLLPPRMVARPPAEGQNIDLSPVWYNLGGGVSAQLYKPLEPGQGYGDLTPFEPNGVDDTYCVGFLLTANTTGLKAPWVAGCHVTIDDDEPDIEPLDGDVTADVLSCSISVNDNALATEAHIEIRNPDYWEIEGLCGCRGQLYIGDRMIFDGLLAEPPRIQRLSRENVRAEIVLRGLGGKMADVPCLAAGLLFDGRKHTDIVPWLLRYAGVPSQYISADSSDDLLPVTASKADYSDSRLRTQTADTPADWIQRLSELTGWRLLDGPLTISTGDPPEEVVVYGYRWVDPLAMSTDPQHRFTVETQYSYGEDAYDLIRSELNAYSVEPEGNEIHVICGGVDGGLVDAVYIDEDAQNPDLEPSARPPGWLGYRKIVTILYDLVLPDSVITALALRIGEELSKRADIVEFTADWPGTIWVGDAIELDMGSTSLPYAGTYRIESMDVDWQSEVVSYPVRRAHYKCVKLDTGLATRARAAYDQRLAQTLSYYMRYGPRRAVQPAGGNGEPSNAGQLNYQSPPTRTIRVNPPEP